MNIIIDGTYDLNDASAAINNAESQGWKITSLSAGNELFVPAAQPPKLVNWAAIVEEDWLNGNKDVELELVPAASKWLEQKQARVTAGWDPVFEFPQSIYVEGKIRNVGVFRKI